jgi:hypothetical protein
MTTPSPAEHPVNFERARRMAALRDALCEDEHPSHPDVVALADLIISIDKDKDRPTDRSGR